MTKYHITHNDYFGFCVVEEASGSGKVVFAGSIEDCNRKCIEMNEQAQRNGYRAEMEEKAMNIKEAYDWIQKNTNLMQDTMMLDFECLAYCVKHGILKEIDKEHFAVA